MKATKRRGSLLFLTIVLATYLLSTFRMAATRPLRSGGSLHSIAYPRLHSTHTPSPPIRNTPPLEIATQVPLDPTSIPPTDDVKKQGKRDSRTCMHFVEKGTSVVDDTGRQCSIVDLQSTGCCPPPSSGEGTPFCEGCTHRMCCMSHTACVSCCLETPNNNERLQGFSRRKRSTTEVYHPFRYCVERCRHQSSETVFQNRYRSEYHHCFASR